MKFCFTRGERNPGTHCIGGHVDLRAALDTLEKKKPLPMPRIEPRFPGRQTNSIVTIALGATVSPAIHSVNSISQNSAVSSG
jgi:hypothetical protein